MTLKISVKAGSWKRLSDQSDYDFNRRYKRKYELIDNYRYLFEAQYGGNPNYDPKALAKAKKTLLNYIPQSTDKKFEPSIDKIEQVIKYNMFIVKTYKNGWVRRNGWKVNPEND